MSFSSEHDQKIQENCDRFNKYTSLLKNAANAVIRATQYLVHPTDGYPSHSTAEIRSLWNEWRYQETVFHKMVSTYNALPERTFPATPYAGAQTCCFRMWGILIQVQIDGTYGSTDSLRETVLEIAANNICKSHPAICACHVPNHPWIYPADMEALAPINAKHNTRCECGGYQRCKQKDEAMLLEALPALEEWKVKNAALGSMSPVLQRQSSYEYTHQVETCACGVCHKSRVDSGTQAAYEKRTRDAADAAIASLTSKREDLYARQDRVKHYASNFTDSLKVANTADTVISKASAVCKKECLECPNSYSPTQPLVGIGAALAKAGLAIETAKAACGGGADHPDFAKNLFAAMGTPHDSKCPHGLPFYACMPCSH